MSSDPEYHDNSAIEAMADSGPNHSMYANWQVPCPALFTSALAPVYLGGTYRGGTAFLICGGPSIKNLDLSVLNGPGFVTMGINNSVKTFRPDMWIGLDTPDIFLRSIWTDPKIQKFYPMSYVNLPIDDRAGARTPAECPNTVFLRRNDRFNPETWLHEDSINWGDRGETQWGGRSTMMAAIRLLFHLGVRKVYLVGADFHMDAGESYHFDQERNEKAAKKNNALYKWMDQAFKRLMPHFEQAGFRVINTNPDTAMTSVPTIPFADAVADIRKRFSIDPADESAAGRYDRHDTTIDKKERPRRGVKPEDEELQLVRSYSADAHAIDDLCIPKAFDAWRLASEKYSEFEAARRNLNEEAREAQQDEAVVMWEEVQRLYDEALATAGLPRKYGAWFPECDLQETPPERLTATLPPVAQEAVLIAKGQNLIYQNPTALYPNRVVAHVGLHAIVNWSDNLGWQYNFWFVNADHTNLGEFFQLLNNLPYKRGDSVQKGHKVEVIAERMTAIVYRPTDASTKALVRAFQMAALGRRLLPNTKHVVLRDADPDLSLGMIAAQALRDAGAPKVIMAGYEVGSGVQNCSDRRFDGSSSNCLDRDVTKEAKMFREAIVAKTLAFPAPKPPGFLKDHVNLGNWAVDHMGYLNADGNTDGYGRTTMPQYTFGSGCFTWEKLVPQDACVVDMGCGMGEFVRMAYAEPRVELVTGVDWASSPMFGGEYAAFICAPVDRTPLVNDYADLVTCFGLLQGFTTEQQISIMKEFTRVTKPGGKILIVFDAREGSPADWASLLKLRDLTIEPFVDVGNKARITLVATKEPQ